MVGVAAGPALTHSAGAARRRTKLAAGFPGVDRAGDRGRAAVPRDRAARRGVTRGWRARRRAGGRIGKTRCSGCSASPSAATTRSITPSTPSCRTTSTAAAEATLIGAALGWMNGSQLVASFLLLAAADGCSIGPGPIWCSARCRSSACSASSSATASGSSPAATLVGFSLAVTFVVTFALPPVLSPPGEVHRMAGGMFTISYTIAVIIPVLSAARSGI